MDENVKYLLNQIREQLSKRTKSEESTERSGKHKAIEVPDMFEFELFEKETYDKHMQNLNRMYK